MNSSHGPAGWPTWTNSGTCFARNWKPARASWFRPKTPTGKTRAPPGPCGKPSAMPSCNHPNRRSGPPKACSKPRSSATPSRKPSWKECKTNQPEASWTTGGGRAVDELEEIFAWVRTHGTQPWRVDGWDQASIWGWDEATGSLYAHLWRNIDDPARAPTRRI